MFPIVPLPPDTALSRWPRLSVGFFETESPSLPFKKVGTNTMIIMASLPTPLDSIFYVQTINYFSEFVKRFFNFFKIPKSCTIFSLETFFQNSCANCIDIQNFSCILLHIKARALRDDRGALFFM